MLTVALLPAVALEVPMGHMMDRQGIRRTLSLAIVLSTITALVIPLSKNIYYTGVAVTAFTVSYTIIFIALYSRMSDIMSQDWVALTGVIATFKDLGYTIGPLLAGTLINLVGIKYTFLISGGSFLFLLPISLGLRD
jgi:MFS family permease